MSIDWAHTLPFRSHSLTRHGIEDANSQCDHGTGRHLGNHLSRSGCSLRFRQTIGCSLSSLPFLVKPPHIYLLRLHPRLLQHHVTKHTDVSEEAKSHQQQQNKQKIIMDASEATPTSRELTKSKRKPLPTKRPAPGRHEHESKRIKITHPTKKRTPLPTLENRRPYPGMNEKKRIITPISKPFVMKGRRSLDRTEPNLGPSPVVPHTIVPICEYLDHLLFPFDC